MPNNKEQHKKNISEVIRPDNILKIYSLEIVFAVAVTLLFDRLIDGELFNEKWYAMLGGFAASFWVIDKAVDLYVAIKTIPNERE